MMKTKAPIYTVLFLFLSISLACESQKTNFTENTTDLVNIDNDCPIAPIQFSNYSQIQTDSFKLRFDNEFRLSIDILKKKLASVGIEDSIQSEVVKIYATTSSVNTNYDRDFFQRYNTCAAEICATFKLLQNQTLKQTTRDDFERNLIAKMREFSYCTTGIIQHDTLTIIESKNVTDTLIIVETIRDTVMIKQETKVVNIKPKKIEPKFIGKYYFTGIYANRSEREARRHLSIIGKKYDNSNIAWNRSNKTYQVYVGPYNKEKNASNTKKEVLKMYKKSKLYQDVYVFKAKRYEKGIIEWVK